ncbi:hypothetical protein LTR97_004525 [Elasticomyces elasticus]|uniref:Amidase domain-containing protein n=1 Tax=Elasticomyces elasticus TaxID=574655 RepID=A0AAN7WC10_9PEZI|nr:hypothetical protein LTR97_004525 [Elasticomyces elasticus]
MADSYLVGPGPQESRPPFIIRNGRLLSLDDQPDVKYLVQISDEAHYPKSELPSLSSLATVLSLHEAAQEVTIEWLSNTVSQYIDHDDVWHPAFLQGIVLNTPVSRKAVISAAAGEWLRQHNTDDFAELDLSSSGNGTIDVAVPSRLQQQASREKPLMNLRIAVKDSFHLRGVPTSICNRSYRDTYGKQPTTAASIKTLVDAGCIVVGKVKMTAFGNWEEPVDYIDFEAPWNPRADGHQSSGGSSSGSAAASAAYEWLDIAMGADSDEQVRLAKLFTADLEKTLEAQAEIVSFEEDWAANPPAEANGLGLQEYMTPGVNNIWYDDYHNADAFREQHWKLFDKAPYIDPFVTAKWSAQSVPNTYIT